MSETGESARSTRPVHGGLDVDAALIFNAEWKVPMGDRYNCVDVMLVSPDDIVGMAPEHVDFWAGGGFRGHEEQL